LDWKPGGRILLVVVTMSLGFLTESALLPSQSKSIRVDGRSLVDLKAVVYEKEQRVKSQGGGAESGAEGLRSLRGKRSAAAAAEAAEGARKDVFARSNRGVGDRSKKDDEEHMTSGRKRKVMEKTMSAKARLYEKLAKGEASGSDAGCMVDFDRKSGADLALLEKGSRTTGEDDDGNSSEVEITDEFGRDRTVRRGERKHQEWLKAKKLEASRVAAQEAYDERYSHRGNLGAGAAGAEPRAVDAGGPWSWGSGKGRSDAGDYDSRQRADRLEGKVMAELLKQEGAGVDEAGVAKSESKVCAGKSHRGGCNPARDGSLYIGCALLDTASLLFFSIVSVGCFLFFFRVQWAASAVLAPPLLFTTPFV
ncbi:unnamed protein product, partial [Discosporangium mesarthrocarpum]